MNTREEIVKTEMKAYMSKGGFLYGDWYVGIAADPRKRLFEEHKAEEESWWIFRDCYTSMAARNVEDYFVNRAGTDGNSGGGDLQTKFVYAYKKTSTTEE